MRQHSMPRPIPSGPSWHREFELFAFANRPMLVHRYGSGARPWRTAKGADESFWLRGIEQAEAILSAHGSPEVRP